MFRHRLLLYVLVTVACSACTVHSHVGCNGHQHQKPTHRHFAAPTSELAEVTTPVLQHGNVVEEPTALTASVADYSPKLVSKEAQVLPQHTRTLIAQLSETAADTTIIPEPQYDPGAPVIQYRDDAFEKASLFAQISFWTGLGSILSLFGVPFLSPFLFLAAIITGGISLKWYRQTLNKTKKVQAILGIVMGSLVAALMVFLIILLIVLFSTW